MKEIIKQINDTHPGYNIYLEDGKIVAERISLGGNRLLGKFETKDELFDCLESQGACE